jgi:serine/threonine-protein kinase HipA
MIEFGNRKFIAKFSSSTDTYNVVKGEYIAMRLAGCVGLNVAPVLFRHTTGKDVLLSSVLIASKARPVGNAA